MARWRPNLPPALSCTAPPLRQPEPSPVDQLIDLVARRAGITPAQARLAVLAVLDFLTAGLPSPVVGRIHELLRGGAAPSAQNGRHDNGTPDDRAH
jgi:hypothetical protein